MISVKHLIKCYGEFTAVDDLSFEIDEGHVYGFLGPNGAGKSTTMNIITGCLSATSGQVTIDGHDIFEEPKEAKRAIGYLPEIPPLYTNETPEEYLKFVAEAKGLKGKEMDRQIEGVISQTRIQNVRKRLISKLSKGYRQRVGIAQALLGNPKVIILDEPTVGLDPIQIIEIRDLIKQLGKNHTVILSSHILSELSQMCTDIGIIDSGRIVLSGSMSEILQKVNDSNPLRIQVCEGEERALSLLAEEKNVRTVSVSGKEIVVGFHGRKEEEARLLKELIEAGVQVSGFYRDQGDLESLFMEMTSQGKEKVVLSSEE